MPAQRPINAVDTAKQTARADARTSSPRSRALTIGAVLFGCGLALLVIIFAGRAVVGVLLFDDQDTARAASQESVGEAAPEEPSSAVADAEGSIPFASRIYLIGTDETGAPALCYRIPDAEGDPLPRFSISGDPVGFALYAGRFYVVSNRNGAYTIQVFVPGDGSMPADYAQGEGSVTHLALENATLVLTLSDHSTETLDLLA